MAKHHFILLLAMAATGCAAPQHIQAPGGPSSAGGDAGRAQTAAASSGVLGLAFVVSPQGHALTSHRLIAGCTAPRILVAGQPVAASLVATRPDEDLALLRIAAAPRRVAVFRAGRCLRVGDDVVLPQTVVSGAPGALTLTDGTVSSLSGPNGEHDLLRMLAFEQADSSGGPLLDTSGRVVGLVSHPAFAAKASTSESVAARESALLSFLDAHEVPYEMSSAADELDSDSLLAKTRAFVVTVECSEGSALSSGMP